jgi:hypothetical protein
MLYMWWFWVETWSKKGLILCYAYNNVANRFVFSFVWSKFSSVGIGEWWDELKNVVNDYVSIGKDLILEAIEDSHRLWLRSLGWIARGNPMMNTPRDSWWECRSRMARHVRIIRLYALDMEELSYGLERLVPRSVQISNNHSWSHCIEGSMDLALIIWISWLLQ